MKNTKEITLEMIQATLDESFVDAHERINTLFSVKVKEELDSQREQIATNLYAPK